MTETEINDYIQQLENGTPSQQALFKIMHFAGFDGAHHKQYVIDQIVRILAGDDYSKFVEAFEFGEDGAETYKWDEGIAP